MAELQADFVYDDTSITKLERSLSQERLGPYLDLANGNRTYAIRLYEWNTKLSEAFYSAIQGFEVTLRNAIHEVMADELQREDWYDAIPLHEEHRQWVNRAKDRVADNGHEITPGRVIAELMFGFWVALTNTDYAQALWDQHVHKAFHETRVGRKEAAKRLKKIRFLRNRVAHHESIIGHINRERNLKLDMQEILEATSWICPTTAVWISHNNSFDYHYAERPREPQGELPFPSAVNPPASPIESAQPAELSRSSAPPSA